jgi:hypothetical protein
MAATFATIRSITVNTHENQWNAPDDNDAQQAGRLTDMLPTVQENDLNHHISGESKSSVESKNAKARARASWKMLRSVVRNLQFPRIKIAEEKLVQFSRNVPQLESSGSHKSDLSSDWLSQLQDFWCARGSMKHPLPLPHALRREQSSKARQRLLGGRGPKQLKVKVDSRPLVSAIRMALTTTPSIFEPGSKFVVGWALIQAALLLYITIVVPFTAVFLSDLDCFPEWAICVDLVIDTYFIADLLVSAVSPACLFHVARRADADATHPAGFALQDAVRENGTAPNGMRQTLFEAAVPPRRNSFRSRRLAAGRIVWSSVL